MSGTQTDIIDGGTAAPPADPEIEARARRMGWKPRDEFVARNGATWVEADEFVQRGETMMPLLLERNRALDKQVSTLGTDLTETKTMMATLLERTRKAEEAGYKRALAELEAKQAAAVDAGDRAAFEGVARQIKELTPPAPAPVEPEKPNPTATAVDPVVASWIEANPWFNRDPEANAIATAIHGVVSNTMTHLSLEEKLAETTRRVRRRLPDLFETPVRDPDPPANNERRRAPAAVSASQSAGSRGVKPGSFESLPAAVQAEFPRVVRMLDGKGKPYTKEEHAEIYYRANPEELG